MLPLSCKINEYLPTYLPTEWINLISTRQQLSPPQPPTPKKNSMLNHLNFIGKKNISLRQLPKNFCGTRSREDAFQITTVIASPSLEPIVIHPHTLLFLLWHLTITPALFNNPLAWVPLQFCIEWVSVRKNSLHRCDVHEGFNFRIILQRTFL